MWVPAHVGIAGNERADFEARQANLGHMVHNDLLPVAKERMLDEWQKSWEVAKTGKFSHSIFPHSFDTHYGTETVPRQVSFQHLKVSVLV
jgi:hypothetical protein